MWPRDGKGKSIDGQKDEKKTIKGVIIINPKKLKIINNKSSQELTVDLLLV